MDIRDEHIDRLESLVPAPVEIKDQVYTFRVENHSSKNLLPVTSDIIACNAVLITCVGK